LVSSDSREIISCAGRGERGVSVTDLIHSFSLNLVKSYFNDEQP